MNDEQKEALRRVMETVLEQCIAQGLVPLIFVAVSARGTQDACFRILADAGLHPDAAAVKVLAVQAVESWIAQLEEAGFPRGPRYPLPSDN